MGNAHPATANIIIHGGEFDDVFAINMIYDLYPNLKWIEYMTNRHISNDRAKMLLGVKNILAEYMKFSILTEPTIISNDLLQDDLNQFKGCDGFKLRIVATGPSSEFISCLVNLISNEAKESFFNPAEIEIVLINSRYNAINLFDSLFKLHKTCSSYNIDLIIKEFSTYGSMGRGSKDWASAEYLDDFNCNSSEAFHQRILNMSHKCNMSKCIIQYGLMVNGSIIEELIPKLEKSITQMRDLSTYTVNSHNLTDLPKEISQYINQLIKKVDGVLVLNYNLCATLANDLAKVAQCAQSVIYKVKMDLHNGLVSPSNAEKYNRQLYGIKNWFIRKGDLARNNLISFPIKNMAAILILNQNKIIEPHKSWAYLHNGFMNVSKDKPNLKVSFPITHYVAKNPNTARDIMEDIIFGGIGDINEKKYLCDDIHNI